ncbi:MAG: hypothetical protein JOZ70_08210 [Pseudolabrys sp.]|nr:hypothetical protein [Pseudolabrys sp.]
MAIKTPDRAAFWQRHLENFQASGLKRSAYCREHGLKLHQLAYHLNRAGKMPAAEAAFARVAVAPAVPVARFGAARLCVGGDVTLEFDSGSDPAWIAQVVTAVGGRR